MKEQKNPVKRIKIKATAWEKIFANYTQLTISICVLCICEFSYSLKCVYNPKYKTHSMGVHKHKCRGANVTHLIPRFPMEVEQICSLVSLYSCALCW